jgi:hypothetical protein
MANVRDSMDRALKGTVVPQLRKAGFSGSFPHFRRRGGGAIDLLTFQFDRNGGGFVVELARCAENGFTTHWGKYISASKVTAWDLNPADRHRLQPVAGSGTDSWFRFDQGQVEFATQELLESLPRAEAWLRDAQPVVAADGFAAR